MTTYMVWHLVVSDIFLMSLCSRVRSYSKVRLVNELDQAEESNAGFAGSRATHINSLVEFGSNRGGFIQQGHMHAVCRAA